MKIFDHKIVWVSWILVSLAILFVALFAFIRKVRSGAVGKDFNRNVPPLNILIIGMFLALLELFTVYNYQQDSNIINDFFVSCFNSIRVFLANEDITILHKLINKNLPEIAGICNSYVSFLYALAPVLLVGYIISFLVDVLARMKYLFFRNRDLYLFSSLNERSIILAEDIRKATNHRKNLILFANVMDKNDPDTYKYLQRADAIGAVCLKKDIVDINISNRSKKRKLDFFLLDKDETSNLKHGIEVIEKYRNKIAANVYVLAVKKEAEIILDSIPKGDIEGKGIKVRRINEIRSMVYDVFHERPLFINVRNKKLSVMIVGAGTIGYEAFKAALWFGQLSDYSLEILVVDRKEGIQKSYEKEFPGLFDQNRVKILNRTSIEFLVEDVTQVGFVNSMRNHPDTSYVVVALGDEDLNIKTAIEIRTFYADQYYDYKNCEMKQVNPLINVAIQDPYKYSTIKSLENVQKVAYNLMPFGDRKELYRKEKVIDSYSERLAECVHVTYGSEKKSFYESEYNRNASISSALHQKYKVFYTLQEVEDIDWTEIPSERTISLYRERLTEDVLEKLSIMEHDRWNAYMCTEGFVRALEEDVRGYCSNLNMHYNILTRKHPCLVAWEELDDVALMVGRIERKNIDYKYYDRFIVEKLPEIYEMAVDMERNSSL